MIGALAVWMFTVRMRTFEKFNDENGVLFMDTDTYYHARHVLYTVENFPSTLGYDALTQYPIGTDPGQFGTLFDQIAAALAWIVGWVVDSGAPTEDTVLAVLTAYPAIISALILIPLYLLARDLFGKGPGIFAALVLALFSGSFLFRGLAAVPDHHMMEALFSTVVIYATYRTVTAWEATGITLDQVHDDPGSVFAPGHRRALGTSLFGALAFWAYFAAWPPAVMFVGIVGAWILIDGVFEHVRGRDPAPVLATGVAMFLPVSALMVPYALGSPTGGFSALNYTWMQPFSALAVAIASLALGAMVHTWTRRDWPRWSLPLGALAAGLVGLAGLRLLLPGLIGNLLSGASWVTGIGVNRTRLTISEAQAMTVGEVAGQFSLLMITAFIGFALVLISALRGQRRSDTLLVIWSVLALRATLTQSRFLYYLAIVVAVLNGEFAHRLHRGLSRLIVTEPGSTRKQKRRRSSDPERVPPRWTAIAVAVLLALPALPLTLQDDCRGDNPHAWASAGCFGPGEERLWRSQLIWLEENTPPIPLSLSTQYDAPPKGERFDYPPGTYGILSWWDYGHQIEFDGRRPPIANPFQQNAPLASIIFTAPNETAALSVLDTYLGEGNDARYLMIDDAMVASKFAAITIWAEDHGPWGDTWQRYNQGARATVAFEGVGEAEVQVIGEAIESLFLIDVYHNDADGMEHFRLVNEANQFSWIGNRIRAQGDGFQFLAYNDILTRMSAQDARSQLAPFTAPGEDPLNFHSAGQAIPINERQFWYDVRVASALKTYERVEGATLTGTATPGADIVAEVELMVDQTGRVFTYEQATTAGPDGAFELTVPYSTVAYRDLLEGGTNTDVRATGPYIVQAGDQQGRVHVPDPVVLDGGEILVELG